MTLTTRKTLRQAVLTELGGRVVTASATTDVLLTVEDLAHTFGDDNALRHAPIHLPSLTGSDIQRRINTWDDSAGSMAIDALSGDPADALAIEIYERGDPSHLEINAAINRCTADLYRMAWVQLPTIQDEQNYSLVNFPWVRKRTDILQVWRRESPQLLANEGFELWGDGSSAELPGWVLSGTGAIAARTLSIKTHHAYAVQLTAAGGVDAELRQTVGLLNLQLRGENVVGSCIVKTGIAAAARIGISDGLTTTWSDYHTGGGGFETLTVPVKTLDAAAIDLQFRVIMEENGQATFDEPIAIEGDEIPGPLQNGGSPSYRLEGIEASRIDYATTPALLINKLGRGQQLVVATAQPFFPMNADTDVTDAPLEALMAGALLQLANINRKGEAKDRWDDIAQRWGPAYHTWREQLIQNPTPNPTRSRAVVQGA
jgi:hypothetical protein